MTEDLDIWRAANLLMRRHGRDAAIVAGRHRATRERVQAESLARLSSELSVPATFLPLLMEDAARPEAIQLLAKRL